MPSEKDWVFYPNEVDHAGSIRSACVINFVRYDFNSCTGQTWRYGYSLGDGRVYGHKIVKAASGVWVDSPDFKVVCAEIPCEDGEDFTLELSQPGAKNTTPGRTSFKVSHA